MKDIVLCMLFLLVQVVNGQTTVSIIADYDAAIGYHDNYNTANNNYGDAVQNPAYIIPGASGGLNENRASIHFDLSGIPNGATITSANLNLYALGPVGTLPGHTGQNNSALLQRVTQNWQDNTVSWNSQPTTTSQNEVTLPVSTSSVQDYPP
ncbi:MAG: DNRLRE domain-containing protein [Flavobacteriales bacterium]|nr:DNRLRE domain-containing protein [Flavobacteriales bacterium]